MSDLKTGKYTADDAVRLLEKAKAGHALKRKEFAVAIGVPYQTFLGWKWVPLVEGRVFYTEYEEARKRQATRRVAKPSRRSAARRPKSTAGKCG